MKGIGILFSILHVSVHYRSRWNWNKSKVQKGIWSFMSWKRGDMRQSNYFPPLSSEKSQICQFDCLSLKASKKNNNKLSLSRSPYKQNGLFLHTSPEVLPNFSLIESISVFLHTSPAISISVNIISIYKVTIVKTHLKFKKLKKLAVVALVSVKYHCISPFHYPKENSLHGSVNLTKISSLTQTFTHQQLKCENKRVLLSLRIKNHHHFELTYEEDKLRC